MQCGPARADRDRNKQQRYQRCGSGTEQHVKIMFTAVDIIE
jgi:hypothetical protein